MAQLVPCPSCGHESIENARYCGRCRLRFSSINRFGLRLRDHLYWIFRRANAGFLSGVVAWFFIPALTRVISSNASNASNVSMVTYFGITGLMGGAFFGTVDGMIEESTPKTVRGAILGGIGGVLGGALFGYLNPHLTEATLYWGLFLFWAIVGAFIGTVSAMWERDVKKLLFGVFFGMVGGGLGGALGYSLYGYMVQEFDPQGWFIRRLLEGMNGGVMGLTLWFALGTAERFFIFCRKQIDDKNHKHCHRCETKNPLSSWYCHSCGTVLQEAARAENLNLSPFKTLERVREMFKFLSRLSITTGFIAGLVAFVVFIPTNPDLAFVVVILVGLISYSCQIVFSAVSESLLIYMNK